MHSRLRMQFGVVGQGCSANELLISLIVNRTTSRFECGGKRARALYCSKVRRRPEHFFASSPGLKTPAAWFRTIDLHGEGVPADYAEA